MLSFSKYLFVLFLFLAIGGCTQTILEKHNKMKSNSSRPNFVTAKPFGAYDFQLEQKQPTMRELYSNTCGLVYEMPSDWPFSYYFAQGSSQLTTEEYAISACEEKYGRTCIVLLHNDAKRCNATFKAEYSREVLKIKKWKEDKIRMTKQAEEKKIENNRKTCENFGFNVGSKEMASCILDLYKGQHSADPTQVINRENVTSSSTDLTKLTNAVMNGWRADYKQQMGALINSSDCSQSINLDNLTNSVMNGWRADYKEQMGALLSCSGCSQSVNLTKLTNSVMNGWRADYKQQMGALLSCI